MSIYFYDTATRNKVEKGKIINYSLESLPCHGLLSLFFYFIHHARKNFQTPHIEDKFLEQDDTF